MTVCPNCDGEGYFSVTTGNGHGPAYIETVECDVCGCTGVIEDES